MPVVSIKGHELIADRSTGWLDSSDSSLGCKDLENRQWYRQLSSLWCLVTIVPGSEGRAAVALEVSESKPFHASFLLYVSMEEKGSEDRKQVLSFLFNVRMSMKLELP